MSWRQGAVVLICRTQVCSSQAARLLARLVRQGSSELRVVKGGMQAWRKLDLPDVSVGSVRM